MNKTKMAQSGMDFSIFRGSNLNLGVNIFGATSSSTTGGVTTTTSRLSDQSVTASINPTGVTLAWISMQLSACSKAIKLLKLLQGLRLLCVQVQVSYISSGTGFLRIRKRFLRKHSAKILSNRNNLDSKAQNL